MVPWIAFNAVVLVLLAIDLGVFNREAHVISTKEAGTWTAVWVSLAMCFAAGMFYFKGSQAGMEFLTGYLIEYSLSVDNIFVFVLLFSYFGVKREYQHRILFWGILGALIMRGTMIAAGTVLINRFHWIIYVFGAFLLITGIRMAFKHEEQIDPEANPVLKLIRRFIPISPVYDGQKFFTHVTHKNGAVQRMATPLFVVLVLIEVTDLVFAVDSIPAIFAVTRDPFIVYTSNIAAILGLRSLYFLLSGIIDKFHHLHYGLAVVLSFVGIKMLISGYIAIPTYISLSVIFLALGTSVVTSLKFPQKETEES